jgi:hypothetical protein
MVAEHALEVSVLIDAARPTLREDEVDDLRRRLDEHAERFDWAFLVDQAYRHRLLPLLGRNLLRHGLLPALDGGGGSCQYEDLFGAVYQANQLRNEALGRELVAVLNELDRHGVGPVVRKGAVLGYEAYADIGVRRSYDIDLIVGTDQVPVMREALVGLGYGEGVLSPNRRCLRPLTRQQAVFMRMRVPNLAFRRPTSERFVDAFVIDVCLNQFLPGLGYDLPPGNLAQRSRPIKLFGAPARAFTPEEMIIDLTSHLFKEATSFHYIRLAQDLTLSKMLDIASYLAAQQVDWPLLVERTRKYAVGPPIFFGLHYTEVVYPGSVPAEVLAELRPADTDFLYEIGAADRDVRRWQGDFISRLFDNHRSSGLPPVRVPA